MVGEKSKVHWLGIMKPKEKKQTFADFTGQFTNKDYKQGGFDCNGYDCIGLVYDFLTKKGNNIPDSFDGLTKENYYVLFNTNKLAAIKKNKDDNSKAELQRDIELDKNEVQFYQRKITAETEIRKDESEMSAINDERLF